MNKTTTTNIVLTNLSQDKLKKVLELCESEKINYTFDKDYYSDEYFDVYKILELIILKEAKVPIVYKQLIENEFRDFIEDQEDSINKNKILGKIENIEYE